MTGLDARTTHLADGGTATPTIQRALTDLERQSARYLAIARADDERARRPSWLRRRVRALRRRPGAPDLTAADVTVAQAMRAAHAAPLPWHELNLLARRGLAQEARPVRIALELAGWRWHADIDCAAAAAARRNDR